MLTLLRNPTTGLAALSAEMDRVLNDFAPARGGWTQGLAPAADVLETEADFRVVLPDATERVIHSERYFGKISRSFRLGQDVDQAHRQGTAGDQGARGPSVRG